MGAVLSGLALVQSSVDRELIDTLRELLHQAETGQIKGLGYITLKPNFQYSGDLIGTAVQHPIIALGVVKALEGQIINLIR